MVRTENDPNFAICHEQSYAGQRLAIDRRSLRGAQNTFFSVNTQNVQRSVFDIVGLTDGPKPTENLQGFYGFRRTFQANLPWSGSICLETLLCHHRQPGQRG